MVLTVSDNDGLTASDTVQVTVEKEKVLPLADAGKDQKISIKHDIDSAKVTLDGSGSADLDGDITGYQWAQGDIVLGSSEVLTVSLGVGTHEIVLTVTDNDGLTACDMVQVIVGKKKVKPIANAGQDQDITIKYNVENAKVTLDGSASYDVDGSISSYQWTEGASVLGDAASITASLGVGMHQVVLTVTDNDGLKATDIVGVTVEREKAAPIANAGQNQQITIEYDSVGAEAGLNGLASSDPDGSIVSYLWREGEVILGDKAVTKAMLGVGAHDISLTVTDNDGLSSTDTLQVVVTQKAPPETGTTAVYVHDITMKTTKKGKNWVITAEVTIYDNSEFNNPVKTAKILGTWTGPVNRIVSKITSSKVKKGLGKAKFVLSGIKKSGTFTFKVNGVAKKGMVYRDALNVETTNTIVIP